MKINKLLMCGVVAGFFGAMPAFSALSLNWTYGGTLTGAGAVPSVQVGWFVQMYQDVSANTLLSSVTSFDASSLAQGVGANTSDDVLLGSFTTSVSIIKSQYTWAQNGLSADALASQSVYTVLFNNATRSLATQAWIIDTTPATLLPAGVSSYTPNSVASTVGYGGASGISVVPEPSSIALIGIGLVAIGLRRRFAK